MAKIISNNNRTIIDIIPVISRKDQKRVPALLKNCAEEYFSSPFRRVVKSPPLKNMLRRNPDKTNNEIPEKTAENIVDNFVPKSARMSRLIPFFSFSVIILNPSTVFILLFIGIATRLTSNNVDSHIAKTPFIDFIERTAPDIIGFMIFITYSFTVI